MSVGVGVGVSVGVGVGVSVGVGVGVSVGVGVAVGGAVDVGVDVGVGVGLAVAFAVGLGVGRSGRDVGGWAGPAAGTADGVAAGVAESDGAPGSAKSDKVGVGVDVRTDSTPSAREAKGWNNSTEMNAAMAAHEIAAAVRRPGPRSARRSRNHLGGASGSLGSVGSGIGNSPPPLGVSLSVMAGRHCAPFGL